MKRYIKSDTTKGAEISLYNRLEKAVPNPDTDIDTRDSDLYVLKTPETTKILKDHYDRLGTSFQAETFKDQVTKRTYYDIPFGYMNEYLDKKFSKRTKVSESVCAATDTPDIKEVYEILSEYGDKTWTNPDNGWTGDCSVYQRDLDDGAYLFSLVFGENESEPDEILYRPNPDGKAMFTIYPYSGAPTFADSISELKRALRKEYSYLRPVK